MKQGQDFEAQQVAELCDTDDWDSAWQLCKEMGMYVFFVVRPHLILLN